jgi:hypothetical protein
MAYHMLYGGRSCTILQIYGVSYVIRWPILYNPTDLWGVIRDVVADLVQSYRSMGCHVIWWPILYNAIELWGVIRDMVADPAQSYRSMG